MKAQNKQVEIEIQHHKLALLIPNKQRLTQSKTASQQFKSEFSF